MFKPGQTNRIKWEFTNISEKVMEMSEGKKKMEFEIISFSE